MHILFEILPVDVFKNVQFWIANDNQEIKILTDFCQLSKRRIFIISNILFVELLEDV